MKNRFLKIVYPGVFLCLMLTGCATTSTESKPYVPASSEEADALKAADVYTSPNMIRKNFYAYAGKELGWAGIIRNIKFIDQERVVQVAFLVEHHYFDWKEHGGSVPYRLLPGSEGLFATAWSIEKPTDIRRLKMQVKEGDMLLVYGKIYNMKKGVVRISPTFVHPIPAKHFQLDTLPKAATEE